MTSPTRPTVIRYIILAMTTMVAVTLYLDRWCVNSVAQDIRDQFRLSLSQVDWLQGAFFFSYAFGQIPCGMLADRYGPRLMLTLYLFTWSMLTGLMGLSTGLVALLLFRLGCGLFEAGAYPACAGIVRRWMPYRQRGFGSAMVSIGGRIGGAIAFPMTAYLMVFFATQSRSPQFSADDIVAPREIARQLIDPSATNEGSLMKALAEHARPHLSLDQKRFLWKLATDQGEDWNGLVDLLNELLPLPDLVAGIDLTPFRGKIPAEAWPAVMPDGSPLSAERVARRNRLLMEVALPRRVCKLSGWGWPTTLFTFGAFGVGLALVFGLIFRNHPRMHPLVNEAEADLIDGGQNASATLTPVASSDVWRGILTSRSLWICSFVQFGTNFGWLFLGAKLPEYLEDVYQVPTIDRGNMLFLPFMLSVPMSLVGGAWTDWLTRRWGPRMGRAFPIASTRFAAAAAFLVCILLNAPWPITLAMCAMSVLSDMGLPALWAYNLDVGGRNVGLILGWGNMWGNLGAAVSPYVLGRIQERFGWDAVFVTCAAVFAVIGVASFAIDATRPIGTPPRAAPN